MAAPRWQFILTDTKFNPVGEILNAQDRTIGLALKKPDTLSFTLRLDNPLADTIISSLGYVKAYRGGILRYFGPIISAEEAAETGSANVAVTSAGAAWTLTKRLTGKSATGRQFTSVTDRAVIARTLIAEANAESSTGIATSAAVASGSTLTYTAGPYRTVYDCLTELATGYDAFDWRVLPVENYANGVVTSNSIGSFNAQPIIGSYQAEAVFEWGTGRNNVKSYSRVLSRDVQANKVYHIASAGPDAPGYPVVSQQDAASISNYLLMEDLAQADLSTTALRQQLVDEHVAIRKNPRTIIKFEPHIDPQNIGTLPKYGVDYDIGDYVRFRAAYGGADRIDAALRIWGVTFTVDSNGVERASAVLAAQD